MSRPIEVLSEDLDRIIGPEDLESVKHRLGGWKIESSIDENGIVKIFQRTIPSLLPSVATTPKSRRERANKLYHNFCDEPYKFDRSLLALFDDPQAVGGEFDGIQADIHITVQGGPITMRDVTVAEAAERYLQQAGYISSEV